MSAGYHSMPQYGQPAYPQAGGQRGAYARQQQQSPAAPGPTYMQQQPSYKGTLAPGTRVQVGNITVTVKRYLSEGGFAHVYLVTTSQPIPMPSSVTGAVGASMAGQSTSERGETVHVLKRMAVPDKAALADVRREVEVHKLLRNQPNIVHFIEASATALPSGGYEIFILMEYCSGGGIISLMNARLRDRLREDEVLKIFGDVCAGVAVMHHLDPPLMHRDLKVENILLAPSTDPGSVPGSKSTASNLKATFKLCDFGSAAPVLSRKPAKSMDEVKRVEADLNKHTTLQYRAPEMVDVYQRRVIDEKADIWALGVFLYKLCYYTTPFEENGGGPLAILNVQYRIPPQPAYSQRLKDLISSLLKEHSVDRPSIDQVIIHVHQILGTRPPSAAVHYAQQAASGKIVAPLPTVVGGSKAAAEGFDLTSIANKARNPQSSEADLISVGPSKKEREQAEARELELQKQSITPMRRGRPTKPSSATESPQPEAVVKPPVASPPPSAASKWSVPSASSKPAPLIEGFGDSFAPSPSANGSDVPPTLPKRPSSSSIPPQPSDKDHDQPASPADVPSKPVDRNLLRPSQGPTPTLSPLRHSPALPGFSAAPSPSASPLPLSKADTKAGPELVDGRDELADRFPTLADLDAKYGGTSSASVDRQNVVVPGLANRASVGAMAGRFEKPFEPQPLRSATASARDSARTSTLTKSATTSSISDAPSGKAGAGGSASVLKRWQPLADSRSNSVSEAPAVKPNGAPQPSTDWLTGDTDDEKKFVPKEAEKSSRPVLDRQTKPSGIAKPVNQPQQADEAGSSDEDDEQDGPEDADARRRPQLSVDVKGPSEQPSLAPSVNRTKPQLGKIRAPSWLVDAVDSPTTADRMVNRSELLSPNTSVSLVSPITDSSAAAEMDEAAKQAQDQLEELLRGPSSSDTPSESKRSGPTTPLAPPALSPSEPVSRVKAPAWDDEDNDEMNALPKPSVPTRLGRSSSVQEDAGRADDKLVDFFEPQPQNLVETSAPTPPRESTPVLQPQGRPLVNLMDDDDEPQQPPQVSAARYAEKATSPAVSNQSSLDKGVARWRANTDDDRERSSARSSPSIESEPQIIQPRRPTAVRATRNTGSSAGLKPWEREAAMSAAASKSGIVKNSALPPASTSHLLDKNDAEPDTRSDTGRGGEGDGFSGVSSLISRWQQSVESNAPGWGRIGSNEGKAGLGHGLGPKVAEQAAGFVQGRNTTRRDLTK